jgi:membrane protease YdiL (CAAX protease family)
LYYWTRWRTGSLYPSILIHFLHNLVVVTVFNG